MKKKVLGIVLASIMAASLAACGSSAESAAPAAEEAAEEAVEEVTDEAEEAADEATDEAEEATDEAEEAEDTAEAEIPADAHVLNIWCWNDEFQSRFNDYYPGVAEVAADKSTTTLQDGTIVKWTINPNEGSNYQDKLDAALLSQDSAADNDKVDIFLIEADYALKYVDSDYSLDIVNDIGVDEALLADNYQYTKDIVTDENGAIKGATWQATPGLFAYRRSIAKDVLGTDDPDEVQAALADWDSFNAVAEKAAAKGYKMLSGYDDSYRTFSNNVSAPWVDGTTVKVDPNIMKWVEQTKEYTDKGYNNKTSLWSPEWSKDQGPEGDVFGFFYSTWGINFTLLTNSLADPDGPQEVGNGIYGDYAVCYGPQPYFWGGTWICAAAGTDDAALIKDIMEQLTTNADIMKQITIDTQDYTNNKPAMEELANDPDFGSDFLGGQNHIALFVNTADQIDMSNTSPYDQGCNENIQSAMKDYFDGNVDLDTAKANFEDTITTLYPELTEVVWPE